MKAMAVGPVVNVIVNVSDALTVLALGRETFTVAFVNVIGERGSHFEQSGDPRRRRSLANTRYDRWALRDAIQVKDAGGYQSRPFTLPKSNGQGIL